MAEDVEMDQKVYDELIAQGKSERIARAKAKAAAVRAKKEAAGEQLGPREATAEAAPAAKAQAAAPAAPAATQQAGGRSGVLTAEERQARVAAALANKGNGKSTEARLAGQEHTHRLLAMVPPSGIQQIRGKQEDKVYTWPHLLSAEFVALLAMTALVLVLSTLPAFPLRDLANPSQTPNPSKAPWYFLGLQELLRYFHPMVAGVTIPGVVGLLGLMMFPYLDKNPSVRPENRKTAYVIMTFFLVGSGVVTMAGAFFRGPGFNWIWPWVDGLFFEL